MRLPDQPALKILVKESLTKLDNILRGMGDINVHEENKYSVTVVEAKLGEKAKPP